jgi:DNA-binding response OmpR family regulator
MFFSKPSVLLIDDDASISLLAKARLMSHDNYQVILSEDGVVGFELALKKRPDLILLDWMMPNLSGLDVLRQLKADEKTRTIPVIMMTGKNMMRDIEQAFSLGAEAYITKPLDLQKLSKKVNTLIKK